MNSLSEIAKAMTTVRNALICGHTKPDGDSLGSAFALALALKRLGKSVTVAGPDPVPGIYSFLPGVESYFAGDPPAGSFDTLITVDCPVAFRLGREYQDLPSKDLTVINIDHHTSQAPFGTYRYTDTSAAAVGEIIYDLLQLMQIDLDVDMAVCLYTAIVTDSGSFQYENTTADTHRRMAGLLETGAPLHRINTLIYDEKDYAAQLLLREALKSLNMSSDGKIAWMVITREMVRNVGAKDEHTEGIVNFSRSIRGVRLGMLFNELADGKVKLSIRTKGAVNANHIANRFGGGGHLRAAGCEITGSINSVVDMVLKSLLASVLDEEEQNKPQPKN